MKLFLPHIETEVYDIIFLQVETGLYEFTIVTSYWFKSTNCH